MKLYIATRWGNPYEQDGPDGKDTNFLVRAYDMNQAAYLAEKLLQNLPTRVGNHRPVQDFIHCIHEIGEEHTCGVPAVIHGPWIEAMIMRSSDYDSWHRDDRDDEWHSISE
jgi:hypothetical protein